MLRISGHDKQWRDEQANRGGHNYKGRDMEKDVRDSLRRVVDHLREQESKNWYEQGKPIDHIFLDVQKVWYWLDDEYNQEGLNIS